MRILKNITIRAMLLIILVGFTLIWGGSAITTIVSLNKIESLLDTNQTEKKITLFCPTAAKPLPSPSR